MEGATRTHYNLRHERRITFDEAHKTQVDCRADLAAALRRSLHGELEDAVDAAWAAEIERRLRDLPAGKTATEDWSAVRERSRGRRSKP